MAERTQPRRTRVGVVIGVTALATLGGAGTLAFQRGGAGRMHAAPGKQEVAPAFSGKVSPSGATGSTAPQFVVPNNAGLLAPGPVCQPISDPSLTGIRCTGSGPVDDPAPLRGSVTPRVVDQEKANFTVFVSNQSFENPLMPITVKIDGYQVTSADFAVLTQHNYVPTALSLAAGNHHVVATAGDGTMIEATFTIPATDQRWGVLSYWASSAYSAPKFEWIFTNERFGFA